MVELLGIELEPFGGVSLAGAARRNPERSRSTPARQSWEADRIQRKPGGPGRDRTDNLFHAMEMQWTHVLDGKELTGRNGRQNRQNWRNLLPICYQNLRVGLKG